MKEDIKKLQEFIKNNPPLNEKGEPKGWYKSEWREQLDNLIPNWKELLKKPDVWKQIKGIRPKRNYDYLLEVILKYAPPEILKEYLESEDSTERESAYEVLIEDNAQKLTVDFWKILNVDTKIWLISKIADRVRERHYHRFLKELEILIHDLEYFFERWKRRGCCPWIYPYAIPLAIAEMILLYEELEILHPLWIKLKGTVEEANDLASIQKIKQIENEFKEKVQRTIEKLKPLLSYPFWGKYSFISKNVLFDASLLLDYEKAQKALSFMREYYKEFNFFIPRSFYKFLKEYGENSKWYKIAEFFEAEKEVSPRRILEMMEDYKKYFNYFEIPKELYRERYTYFYENLYKEVKNKELVDLLFEEWVFLQEFSWIVAKSKKAFEKFKEAGAIVIEISKKAFDRMIKWIDQNECVEKIARHKLGVPPYEIISISKKLRGLGKWIAHGGITVIGASFSNPVLGALFGYMIGEGIFVLIDPIDIMEESHDGDGV